MSILDVERTLSKITENIVNKFKEGSELAADPNYTQADQDKYWQDIDDVGKGSSRDSFNEAYAQAKEAATKNLMDRGWSEADVDRWFNPRWEKIKNAAEQARGSYPEVEKAAHSIWGKVVGFVGAIGALAVGTAIIATVNSGPTPEEQAASDILHRSEERQAQIERLSEILISGQELDNMVGRLTVPSAPTPTEYTEFKAIPVAPLPPPVAAVAAVPVQVIIATPTARREFTSNIESVYLSSPEPVQDRIEQTISSSTGAHHKTFTVSGTPFGSVTFSY